MGAAHVPARVSHAGPPNGYLHGARENIHAGINK